jgi:hypothetical protein
VGRIPAPLLSLLVLISVALVSPTSVGARGHRGEAFHPIIPHQHPDDVACDDPLIFVPAGQPGVQGTHAGEPSSTALGTEVLPRTLAIVSRDADAWWLVCSKETRPGGVGHAPLDPPPELV